MKEEGNEINSSIEDFYEYSTPWIDIADSPRQAKALKKLMCNPDGTIKDEYKY